MDIPFHPFEGRGLIGPAGPNLGYDGYGGAGADFQWMFRVFPCINQGDKAMKPPPEIRSVPRRTRRSTMRAISSPRSRSVPPPMRLRTSPHSPRGSDAFDALDATYHRLTPSLEAPPAIGRRSLQYSKDKKRDQVTGLEGTFMVDLDAAS